MNWEDRKKAYMEKADSLAPVPKDLKYFSKFNTLKMGVMEKVERDIKSGKISKEDAEGLNAGGNLKDFAFSERYLNVMMHYAFEEGKHSVIQEYARHTKALHEGYEKIADILDGLDKLPVNCNCDN
jgi:hypothetical protein